VSSFERVIGRRTAPLDAVRLREQAANAGSVLLDVGTGDGRFVLDVARQKPDWFCIGIDPVAENMQRISRLAAGKPARGGAENALFLRGSAEQLPGPLRNIADYLTVNYPWGSLLRILAAAEPAGLRRLIAACRDGANVSILLNRSVLDDASYAARLGLPAGDFLESREFADAYRAAGIVIRARRSFHGDPPIRTMWGRHLVRGSARTTFMVEGVVVSPAAGEIARDMTNVAEAER
jgi:16S rRNA (adenine(1408)-N(1))-methyltransferase